MRKITRRSFLTAAAACGAAAALSACGGSSSASSVASSTAASVSAAADGQKFTVGICQLVQHAALDAATQGFEDALTASFGENVTFDFQNAQGDSATCATIANGFVSSGVALIMANATPALQAAQAATNQGRDCYPVRFLGFQRPVLRLPEGCRRERCTVCAHR